MAYSRKPKSNAAAKAIAIELNNKLAETVQTLVTSDAWPKLLASMVVKNKTEIGRYSFNNMLLILSQLPEATAVCSSKAWAERGRFPRKGTKALRIYAPMKFKEEQTETRDGKKTQDKIFFRMIPVFDVSQTDPILQNGCQPMTITPAVTPAPIAKQLTGDAPAAMWKDVADQIEALGYTIERGPAGGANGYTNPKTMTVRVRDDVSDAQAVKTLAHELGHILAGHTDDLAAYRAHQGASETVAESFAYMVGAYYGLDTAGYSAPYIGVWAGREADEVLKAVQDCGSQVLTMFRKFLMATEAPEAEQAQELTSA